MDLKTCLGYVEKMNKKISPGSEIDIRDGHVYEYHGTAGCNKNVYSSEDLFGHHVDLDDFKSTLDSVVDKVMWKAHQDGLVPYEMNLGNIIYSDDVLKIEYVGTDGVSGSVSFPFENVSEICKEV